MVYHLMKTFFVMLILLPLFVFAAPTVKIETSIGAIVVELDAARAPKTVQNFMAYVESGHYDGTIFHRVIDGFMIQGGGFDQNMQPRLTGAPVVNESNNGLKNKMDTIAMARAKDANSATDQFFINVADNPGLDFQPPSQWGYTVFGKVIAGMDVVIDISKKQVHTFAGIPNVPLIPIVINKIAVIQLEPK